MFKDDWEAPDCLDCWEADGIAAKAEEFIDLPGGDLRGWCARHWAALAGREPAIA